MDVSAKNTHASGLTLSQLRDWPPRAILSTSIIIILLCCEVVYGFLDEAGQAIIIRALIAGYCMAYLLHCVAYAYTLRQSKVQRDKRLVVIIIMAIVVGGSMVALMMEWSSDVQHLFCILAVSDP
ncbi:hypothetical protein EYZ11_013151 [Aspergillus tanneri]|uniref:Uncharacterized protein n=1 Tax=Aspergillus tanneri TaxID=1220188 RepID=A0A4S3IYG6_9EURO|nr:hypothetical protein EYZ11_013151 [Aspergillus tanneri]